MALNEMPLHHIKQEEYIPWFVCHLIRLAVMLANPHELVGPLGRALEFDCHDQCTRLAQN